MADKQPKKLRGGSKAEAISSIVKTDNTFNLTMLGTTSVWQGKCLHCNTNMIVSSDGYTNATIEHIVPLTAGGSLNDPRNLALACKRCNNEKGIQHDPYVGKGGSKGQRADEVVQQLLAKRLKRWRDPE